MPLFSQVVDARTADLARRQRAVIARLGRFPHRKAATGGNRALRLQRPRSSFGQLISMARTERSHPGRYRIQLT